VNISEFTKRVMPDVQGCPQVMAEQAVLDTLSDFCAQTWVLTRGLGVTISTVDSTLNDQTNIDLGDAVPSGFRPVGIKLFSIDGVEWPIDRMYVVNHVDVIASELAKKFYYFENNQSLVVFPVAVGSAYIEVAIAPNPDATTIDDHIYNFWIDPVVCGAKSRLLRMPGKTWTNGEGALIFDRVYSRGVVQARRQANKSFTKTSLSVTPRSDQVWF